MDFTLSYTGHTILSIFLHFLGVFIGLFVWYLFPKHPTRSIVQLPAERVSLIIEPSTVTVQPQQNHVTYSPLISKNVSSTYQHEKLIDIDDSTFTSVRQFG